MILSVRPGRQGEHGHLIPASAPRRAAEAWHPAISKKITSFCTRRAASPQVSEFRNCRKPVITLDKTMSLREPDERRRPTGPLTGKNPQQSGLPEVDSPWQRWLMLTDVISINCR
jgi:hypothetical protein